MMLILTVLIQRLGFPTVKLPFCKNQQVRWYGFAICFLRGVGDLHILYK